MFSLPSGYIAYHQPNKSGYISPRKLVKAQQNFAFSQYGCQFMNGQADAIEKIYENLFSITVKQYMDDDDAENETTQTITVFAKRVIIATGAYANIKPDIKVW